MKGMRIQRISEEGTAARPQVGRRRFLGGVGAGGLATAATVFGFATQASATVQYGCCNLCCAPTHTLAECESGAHYVWTCTQSTGVTCQCCEHKQPCKDGCSHSHYSTYSCT